MRVRFVKNMDSIVDEAGTLHTEIVQGVELDLHPVVARNLIAREICESIEGQTLEVKVENGGPIRKLSEVVKPKAEMAGVQVTKEKIQGQEVVLQKVEFRPSTAEGAKEGAEYASIQILQPNGLPGWLNVGAEQVVETLKQVESQLPLRAKFVSHKSPKTKRTYWVLE